MTDVASAVDFVRTHSRAVLTTYRGDGQAQLSPVVVAVDDDGRLVVSTTQDRAKTRNLRRDPRMALCVLSDGFFGPWVQVEGEVEIVDLPDAMDLLVDYYRRLSGEHPDWDDYRRAMVDDRRCVLRLAPTRASGTVAA